ncbi:MAG: transcription antitermination factor NusB [Hyphomicrobiaceae bacterium]|nr:transcription antitermination factor NusB [Hyphomicrobiaceae bacterium]
MSQSVKKKSGKKRSAKRKDPAPRSAARLGAVQALYQMDMAGTDLAEVVQEFEEHRLGVELEGDTYKQADTQFFEAIIEGVVRVQRDIDPMLDERLAAGWRLTRIDSILRAILRAAAFELQERHDVPVRVVLNEYIDIARAFFEGDEPKVVNGVLDKLAKHLRPKELSTRPSATKAPKSD